MPTFVLRCETGREERIKQFLSRFHPLDLFHFWVAKKSIYHRNNERERQRRGEALTLIRTVLFPGYLFVDGEDIGPGKPRGRCVQLMLTAGLRASLH